MCKLRSAAARRGRRWAVPPNEAECGSGEWSGVAGDAPPSISIDYRPRRGTCLPKLVKSCVAPRADPSASPTVADVLSVQHLPLSMVSLALAMLHRHLAMLHLALAMLHLALAMLHLALAMLHRTLAMLHRTLAMLHRTLAMLHRTLPMLHRTLEVLLRTLAEELRQRVFR